MKRKIQYLFLFGFLSVIFLGQGCEMAPVFVLWNNTSSDAKIEWYNGEAKTLKSHSKHKLQNIPTEIAGRKFSAVILWKGQQYGYVLDFESLFNSETVHLHRHDFQLEEDGKVYLLNPKGQKYGILTNQPPGFPLEPILISEAK
jgi:hypothetical protein